VTVPGPEDESGFPGTDADGVLDDLPRPELQRRLQESLRTVEAMRARLACTEDRLAAFAGQVTHDLKTPLTTMSLSLELIRDELEDGAAAEDLLPLLSRALGASTRMNTMIEDVLAFARLDTSIDPVPVDLAKVAEAVVAGLDSPMEGVDLTIGELPVVAGDEVLLSSLLQNLLSNAVKFRSPERAPVVSVASARAGSRWRITVVDNGVGIPEPQREQVFEPMVRLDKRIEGVGIGLATCRRVVEAHRGAIGVTDNSVGGSTFWVELPA
jgi:signal transduction histidine kinase